jgi:uncharacterized membrane protein
MFSLTPRYEVCLNYLTVCLLIGLIMLTVYGLVTLPERIPVHFGLNGQADRWGSPIHLLIVAGVCLFVEWLLWVTRRLSPEFMNFPGPRTPENVARQVQNIGYLFATIRPLIALLFLSLVANWIWVASSGGGISMLWVILPLVSFLLVITGVFLVRAYRLAKG